MKNPFRLLMVFWLAMSLTACAGREMVPLPVVDAYDVVAGATPSDTLRVGLIPGLYSDMFTEIIEPLLEAKGYSLEITYYDCEELPNVSLARKQTDLNMFQHYKALNHYKIENDAALSAIAEVPTAPMGIYSAVYSSLREIEMGATVSVPIESTDFSRALVVLENAGLITLDPVINKEHATEDNIIDNPYALVISPLHTEDLLQSLATCALSVIDGGYAVSGHLDLSQALYNEVMQEAYLIVIAVRTDALHAQFISDIISIVNSDTYKNAITTPNGKYTHLQRPSSFYE